MASSPATEAAVRAVRGALLGLSVQSPFFGTLALFAELRADDGRTQTAATDGRRIFFSPAFVLSLSREELWGLLMHEVLHAALLHPQRCGLRSRQRWNVAADIVTNGIVRTLTWAKLPAGAIIDAKLEHFSVEEVYELLPEAATPGRLADLLADDHPGALERMERLAAHWGQARAQADVTDAAGARPQGLQRELGALHGSVVDWRAELWRFSVHTPDDFEGFDRRFVYRGLYLESLVAESLSLSVAIDTSGSISTRLLGQFLGELRAILGLYPKVRGELYFADAELYGPFDVEAEIPAPKGGGGTSFVPFFERIYRDLDPGPIPSNLAIYLTDGHGAFPARPQIPVLWLVPPGGAADACFPFGQVVRMIDR